MDDFCFVKFKNYDIPKNKKLDISVILPNTEDKDFVFIDRVDKRDNTIVSKDLKFLQHMKKYNYFEGDIIMKIEEFLKDVEKSFRDSKDIWLQCEVDLSRCRIFINRHRVKNIHDLRDFLEYKFNRDISSKIAMLTTQALLGLPFEIIFNNLQEDDYHIGELDEKHSLTRRQKKKLQQKRKPYRISIDLTDENIHFLAYKEFRIFKISKNSEVENKYRVYLKLDFNLNHSDSVLINLKITPY